MISIIIPIYNAEKWLNECLESISKQSYSDFEVLMIDDGSSDNSSTICKQFAMADNRFHYYFQKNSGVSAARNLGLNVAKGDFISFIDSDDSVDSNYLGHLLLLSNNGSMGICGYTRRPAELGRKESWVKHYSSKDYILQILNESIPHPTIWLMLFKKNLIRANGLCFTVGCVRNEDTEFYMKYVVYEKDISVSDYKGYFYRDNPSSADHKYDFNCLTIIEADQRISDFLVRNGIVSESNLIVPSSVQYLVFKTARFGYKDIYNKVHDLYDVKTLVKKVTKHHRFSRKLVAVLYVILGRSAFYNFLSFPVRLLNNKHEL